MLAHTQVHHRNTPCLYTHTDNIYTNMLYSQYTSTHVPYTIQEKKGGREAEEERGRGEGRREKRERGRENCLDSPTSRFGRWEIFWEVKFPALFAPGHRHLCIMLHTSHILNLHDIKQTQGGAKWASLKVSPSGWHLDALTVAFEFLPPFSLIRPVKGHIGIVWLGILFLWILIH